MLPAVFVEVAAGAGVRNGGPDEVRADRVETPRVDLTGVVWRKSSRSGGGTGDNCVELATVASTVAVRDSKSPDGPILAWSSTAWRGFVRELADRA
jgi:hypothetical protein